MTLWNISQLPVPMDEDGASIQLPDMMPPTAGLSFKRVTLPPGYGTRPQDVAWHETDTIDLITILDGEIWCGIEGNDKQVLLQTGDSLVQRGNLHAWFNRTDQPVTMNVVMVSSRRVASTPRTKKTGVRSYYLQATPEG